MTMNEEKTIDLGQGWELMQRVNTQLKNNLDGLEPKLSYEDTENLSLEKHGESILTELVHRWDHHIEIVNWLSNCFQYLEGNYISQNSLPSLHEVGITCFRVPVYQELYGRLSEAVISLNNNLLKNQANKGEHIDRSLLKNVLDIFVEVGMGKTYRKNYKVEDLSRMAELCSQIPGGLIIISRIFAAHLVVEARALVEHDEDAASNEKDFVMKAIKLRDKYYTYTNDCFKGETCLLLDLKIAFQEFWRKGVVGMSCSKILASFCDNIIRKGGNEAIEETLQKVEDLLDYITCADRDLFAKFYWKKMTQRLLFYKNANVEFEAFILTQLRWHLQPFIGKMGQMLRDLTLAKQNEVAFEDFLSTIPYIDLGIDFAVTVLTDRRWPCYKSFHLNLPTEMVKCVKAFTEFYQTKKNCRKLTWINSLGTCKLIGNFESKSMELVVTTAQACALLLFNEFDRIKYSDIKVSLKLPDKDLVRVLQPLSCAKHKILKKEPNTQTISPSDYFEFNSEFTDRRKRIKISIPPLVEKKVVVDDETRVQNRIHRSNVIGATIMRIMKRHKVLGFQRLSKECLEQLCSKLKLHRREFKMQIESLIEQEYLMRDKSNPNLFRYIP
ncbi:hypothetical protein SLEP1_g40204 [Rubroshorea leprosula]|uniref:Cullin family profile domain-containing protein n=1 Tax=Rubroshorea leprosula TaxID=152421 RepID=A0AAV5L3I9_9ROSI|nr:hypothetical protein SLEP1_g40204 [Rubroshorea leprosula]